MEQQAKIRPDDPYGEAIDSHKPIVRTSRVIVFGLRCDGGHEFEGWFRSNTDFADQQDAGNLSCPACASYHVEKAIMAPNLARSTFSGEPVTTPYGERPDLTEGNGESIAKLEAEIAAMRRQIKDELRDYVDTNLDYVGDDFSDEARRRFYEAEDRGIYGEATLDEMVDLTEEGITVAPLPADFAARKKLN
jgi:hypothetical protein